MADVVFHVFRNAHCQMVILAAVVKYDDRMPFREAHRRSMQTVVHLITDAHEALGNLENFQRTFLSLIHISPAVCNLFGIRGV